MESDNKECLDETKAEADQTESVEIPGSMEEPLAVDAAGEDKLAKDTPKDGSPIIEENQIQDSNNGNASTTEEGPLVSEPEKDGGVEEGNDENSTSGEMQVDDQPVDKALEGTQHLVKVEEGSGSMSFVADGTGEPVNTIPTSIVSVEPVETLSSSISLVSGEQEETSSMSIVSEKSETLESIPVVSETSETVPGPISLVAGDQIETSTGSISIAPEGQIEEDVHTVRTVSIDEAEGTLGVVQADGTVAVMESGQQGLGEPETITISLEEATQIFLQQQGLQGAVQIAPGTYLQVAADGTLGSGISAGGDPLHVIATGDGDLVGYSVHPEGEEGGGGMVAEVGGQLIRIDKSSIDGASLVQAGETVKQEVGEEGSILNTETGEIVSQGSSECQVISTAEGQFTVAGAQYVQGEGGIIVNAGEALSSEPHVVAISEGKLVTVSQGGHAIVSGSQLPAHTTVQLSSAGTVMTPSGRQLTVSSGGQIVSGNTVQYSLLSGTETLVTNTTSSIATSRQLKLEPKTPPPPRQPDLNSPISVEDKTEVVINGKKCLLMMNPETKQMCAYPLLPPSGKKKRGRPRKPRPGEEGYEPPSTLKPSSPVAEAAPDTPTEQMSSAAEGLLELSNAGPDGVRRSNRPRKKAKVLDDYDILEESGSDGETQPDDYEADPEVTIAGFKRRKVAVSPSPGMTIAYSFQGAKRGRGRPRRYPPAGQSATPSTIPAVIIPSANGQTLMMAPIQGIQNIQALQSQAKSMQKLEPKPTTESSEAALAISDPTLTTTTSTPTPTKLGRDSTATSIALDSANSSILDNSNILINELPPTDGGDSDNEDMETEVTEKTREGEDGSQATIIQIPENMLNMFVQKKDPVKIGIKASEIDLEKLRCPKCDFQACYPQQYQDHIATHGEDIHKCKCCNFLTFNKDDLMDHFKETHPRCICNICNFMAEHAYIIKRHMMRHNAQGCTCEICGKIYKDQYILKMHIKMVHMPAEVLFECTVCAKKFTRKAHLKRHLRIHDPEKPFKCPHCDYRGCERSDISKHLLIHQDPKHLCEVCGKPFRHIKNKELHVKRHNGQRDYKCGVCDFYGYTFTDIRKHIERKHADIKTLVCDRCGSAFKSEALLREHQKDTCEVMMIEQALAIATSSGGTSQATIQFPSSLSVDGKHITIDGQQIAVDQIAVDGSQVNITVEQVMQDDEEGLTMTEDQVVDGQIAVTEAQVPTTAPGMAEVIQVGPGEEEEELEAALDEEEEEDEEMMSIAE